MNPAAPGITIPDNPKYREFHRLYQAITNELGVFIAEAVKHGEATRDEADWFQALINGFGAEFAGWDTTPQAYIQNYLGYFENSRSPLLRVAAHAFLHIAYDLPRVLANNMGHPNTNRSSLRNLFLRPAPRLRQIFRERIRVGDFGCLLRPLGRFEPVEMLAHWVIALRSVAWIHAEILADNANLRAFYEANLAAALHRAGDQALSQRWIWGVPRLEISRLFQMTPAAASARPGFLFVLLTMLVGSFVVLGLLVNRSLAARIGFFGERVLLEITKGLFGEHGKPPP